MTDLPYRAIWERELRAGMYGQDRMRHSTWKIDALYLAVCQQCKAEDAEAALALALAQGAHPDSIEALVAELDRECERAHDIFNQHSENGDAAA